MVSGYLFNNWMCNVYLKWFLNEWEKSGKLGKINFYRGYNINESDKVKGF